MKTKRTLVAVLIVAAFFFGLHIGGKASAQKHKVDRIIEKLHELRADEISSATISMDDRSVSLQEFEDLVSGLQEIERMHPSHPVLSGKRTLVEFLDDRGREWRLEIAWRSSSDDRPPIIFCYHEGSCFRGSSIKLIQFAKALDLV